MKNLIKSFLMLAVMLFTFSTAWAETVNVRYKDADGTTKYVDATVLNNTMNDLAAGWYVVNSFVDYNDDDLYTNASGDVNIILCDGATLTAKNITPKGDSDKIKIYGQRQGTGTADISGSITGNYSLAIYGGTINASELDGYRGGVGINGGTVNVGSISPYGSVYLYGGNVTVTGEINARDGNVDLAGGTVKANSYSADQYVCIEKGLTYYDGTGASYTGTEGGIFGLLNLTADEIAAIAGKTLRTFNYGSCGIQTVNDGNDVTWMMSDGDNNGSYETLIISGTGAMANFTSADDQPWKDSRADIKKVIIEADITSIGNNAFNGCSNLKMVCVLGENLPSLGTNAFDGCTSLSKIYISPVAYDENEYGTKPNWSTYSPPIIDQFFYCGDPNKNDGKNVMCYFTDDDNDDKIETLTIIGTGAIMDCSSAAAIWDDFRLTIKNLIIEEGVTEIGNSAFKDCTSLTTVDIPASVTHIRPYAFKGCTSLTTAPIGSGVIYIGNRAFEGCTGLTSATIPAGLEEPVYDGITQYNGNFGLNAFEGCTNLTTITVAADNPTFKDVDGVMMSKDGTALVLYPQGKTATNYIVPDGVKSIIQQAFKGSSHLTDVTLPDGLTTICMSAFQSCTGLTSIVIPASVTNIETMAFRFCSNLKTVLVQRYDADDETKIMTLGSSDVFEGCPNDLAIYVPYVALNNYKEATNWSTYSDKINAFPVSVTIGDETTNYTSFAEAVAYAGEMYDPETPAVVPTVILYDDINLGGSGFEFGNGTDAIALTLDLNGHTISGDAEYLITVDKNYTLHITGDGAIANNSYFGCLIANYGTLNIAGGTFTVPGGCCSINNFGGSLTVSGGTFNVNGDGCAIQNWADLTLSALPTFVHAEGATNCIDIDLNENTVITFDKAITTFPTTPIVVKVKNAAPYMFTSGYGTYVKDANDKVIDPASVFAVTADNSLLDNAVLGIHASEAALFVTQNVTFQRGKTTYYSDKGLKLLGVNDDLKFYTVTSVNNDVASLTEITGKTFGKETPLIVNNSGEVTDAIFVLPFDDTDDAAFAASCATDLGTASIFSGFKGTAVAIDEIGFNNYKTYFGFTGHDFVKIRNDGPVAAHRCWIEMGGSSTFAKRLNLRWNEEEVTGVKGVNASLEVKDDSWYTIDGRKLNGHPTKQGVYINNGVKVFVK